MRWKSRFILPIAKQVAQQLHDDASRAVECQDRIRQMLIRRGANTHIGKELGFNSIRTYQDFRKQIPIRDYEGLRSYIDMIAAGEQDILWPGTPRYFAKSSGTTSGVKYIPITSESIPNHIGSARNALFNYAASNKKGSRIFDGKMIFLSGSPELEFKRGTELAPTPTGKRANPGDFKGIPTGRLSGIVNHLVPRWLRNNQLPSYETNCIEDWERKVDRIVEECLRSTSAGIDPVDMRLISGIPPWVQMYYERLLEVSGKKAIREIFPRYSLFVYGGVNYAPYAARLRELVGFDIDTLETYPASEGFIAYQDIWPSEGLRLNINSGIFFEFVPLENIHDPNPDRFTLKDIELDKDYAVMINSNAGLWGYNIGDTVRFVSKDPYRVIVSGRVEHFISAFGEHVIAKEVDQAMSDACSSAGIFVTEFTVAPQVSPPDGGAPYHEWFIEFDKEPTDLKIFRDSLEKSMLQQNIYYKDLIDGHILRPLVISKVPKDGFRKYMESVGKLGGQNKVARLKNDRSIGEKLILDS